MTGGIRERARGYLDRFVDEPTWDVYSPDAEQALVDLLLAERAAALGAAGDVVTTCRRCGCSLIASGLPHCEDRCSEEDVEPEPLDHAAADEYIARMGTCIDIARECERRARRIK